MQSAVDEEVFPGAVLAVRASGRLHFTVAVGRLSSDRTSPSVESTTVYDLASLTKPLVTATSVLLLIQQAKLALDHRVETILDEVGGSEIGKVSVQDLLTHSSGLPGWRPLYERLEAKGVVAGEAQPRTIRQAVLQLIRDEPLIYIQGTKSLYSDLSFILLGLVVERVGGLSLDQFYLERVVKPLRAAVLHFRPCAKTKSNFEVSLAGDVHQVAPTEWDDWRGRLLHGEVHDENAAAMGGIAGHAGLFGTAEAVLAVSGAWLRAYRGQPSILNPELARQFATRQSHIPQSSWALGWDTPSVPSSSGSYFSTESFGHLGYTGTSLWIDPKKDLEVVLLSNRVHPSRRNEKIREFRPLIHDLVARNCGSAS